MLILFVLSSFLALAMAWAIGAQDVSNCLGTAVGSKAISVRQAILIGGVFEFAGSLLGGQVATTISKEIISPDALDILIYSRVMFATLAGAFLWLAIATYYSLPVSTSHSLVGALLGIALSIGKFHAVDSTILQRILISWFTSPILGGLISYSVFYCVYHLILKQPSPEREAQKWMPYFWGFTIGVLSTFFLNAGPSQFRCSPTKSLFIGTLVAASAVVVFKWYFNEMHPLKNKQEIIEKQKHQDDEIDLLVKDVASSQTQDSSPKARENSAEQQFTPLMIVTACVLAVAHGSNDTSNSVGPYAAILEVYFTQAISHSDPVPFWVLMFGGIGIVFGLATYGYKVMATVGEKIVKMTHSRGFAAQIGTALTVLGASILGLSVSTTHCLIGAIAGIALVESIDKLNVQTLQKIVVSWAVTLPAAALFGIFSYGVSSVLV